MAADIFADYLVGQLVTPGTPIPGKLPSPVSVTPPPGAYPDATWFDITHVSGANFFDLRFDVPSALAFPPHGIKPLCILVFRIGPSPNINTVLGYTVRLNPPVPGTLTSPTEGDEIFNGHVWGDHSQSLHCLFETPGSFAPGAKQYIRFVLTTEAGDHGKIRIADVVWFYHRDFAPPKK